MQPVALLVRAENLFFKAVETAFLPLMLGLLAVGAGLGLLASEPTELTRSVWGATVALWVAQGLGWLREGGEEREHAIQA